MKKQDRLENYKVWVRAPRTMMVVEGSIAFTYELCHSQKKSCCEYANMGNRKPCMARAQFFIKDVPDFLRGFIEK